ncbi:MAG: SMEK domain-containing protein [Aeromonas sobria]
MITRGYYIGQIIDELSSVTEKVRNRAKLGLTDVHVHLEDFYREILNITLGIKLRNLNQERKNSPGLDLGDEVEGVAFQITGTKNSKKVNKTLEKAAAQVTKFPNIKILTLQNKQASYSISEDLAKPFGFTEDDIWDVNNVLNEVMYLEIDKLQALSELISKELARVTIELEIPDKDGKYQTNIDKYVESIPKARFSGVSAYLGFHSSKTEQFDLTEKEVEHDFKLLISTLRKLPRITRQFYAMIYSRSKWSNTGKYINEDYLKRICSFPDMDGELRLLGEAGLCWWSEPDDYGQSATYQIRFPAKSKSDCFLFEFNEFIEANSFNIENALVTLDFSSFD